MLWSRSLWTFSPADYQTMSKDDNRFTDPTLFRKNLEGLRSRIAPSRELALESLYTLSSSLSKVQISELLRAAVLEYPERPRADRPGYGAALLDLLYGKVTLEDIVMYLRPPIKTLKPDAAWTSIDLVASIATEASAREYVSLLKDRMSVAPFENIPLNSIFENPHAESVYFPALFEYAHKPEYRGPMLELSHRFCEEERLEPEDLKPINGLVYDSFDATWEPVKEAQQSSDGEWMWKEPYSDIRHGICLLLDLMGYMECENSVERLRNALALPDPRLKMFAVLALVRLGENVAVHELVSIAQSSETRNLLYDGLASRGRQDLFPVEYSTQEAFAESDMVNWLAYPTELGRPPSDLELMKVIFEEDEDGTRLRFYVWKFCMSDPHWASENGWMAAISGPFDLSEGPNTCPLGSTFSRFDKWDSYRPEQHLDRILELFDSE